MFNKLERISEMDNFHCHAIWDEASSPAQSCIRYHVYKLIAIGLGPVETRHVMGQHRDESKADYNISVWMNSIMDG